MNIKEIINKFDTISNQIDDIKTEINDLRLCIKDLEDLRYEYIEEIKKEIDKELQGISYEIYDFWENRCTVLKINANQEVGLKTINSIAKSFNIALDEIALNATNKGIYVHIYW